MKSFCHWNYWHVYVNAICRKAKNLGRLHFEVKCSHIIPVLNDWCAFYLDMYWVTHDIVSKNRPNSRIYRFFYLLELRMWHRSRLYYWLIHMRCNLELLELHLSTCSFSLNTSCISNLQQDLKYIYYQWHFEYIHVYSHFHCQQFQNIIAITIVLLYMKKSQGFQI